MAVWLSTPTNAALDREEPDGLRRVHSGLGVTAEVRTQFSREPVSPHQARRTSDVPKTLRTI